MADVQTPVEVPAAAPAVVEPLVPETIPTETTAATETPAVEASKAEETTAEPTATEAAAPVEEAKKEVKPIEEGTLEHKGAPASFPKNILYSKQHFWFGSEPIPSEKLASYLKAEKAAETAHHVASWASETGKGLLFYGKDTSTPVGAIQLAEASEPTTDGTNKFVVHAKGHKHSFKAANATERDNWVSQFKLKIAEAKELATTVTESESYKKTLESLKPTPAAKKEEKPVAAETTETPATTEAAVVEAPKEEEELKEEKKEEAKPSASKKRASIFGGLSFGKKEEKKEEKPVAVAEDAPAATELPAETAPAADPIVAEPVAATEAPVETTAEAPATETAAVAETKPTPTKRNSLFGNLSFGKKKTEAEAAPVTAAKDTTTGAETEPVSETAPVIPPVETNEPLSAEVASPATVPTETVDATPATNGETKKETKSEKRKSSLPFAFGKKEKSATSDEEGEKKPSLFSNLRQTVKRTTKAPKKSTDKPTETAETPETTEAAAEPLAVTEPEPLAPVEAAPLAEEAAAEPVATTTPAVSAAA